MALGSDLPPTTQERVSSVSELWHFLILTDRTLCWRNPYALCTRKELRCPVCVFKKEEEEVELEATLWATEMGAPDISRAGSGDCTEASTRGFELVPEVSGLRGLGWAVMPRISSVHQTQILRTGPQRGQDDSRNLRPFSDVLGWLSLLFWATQTLLALPLP